MNPRIAIALVSLVAVAVMFFALRPGDGDDAPETQTFTRAATPPTIEPADTGDEIAIEFVDVDARDEELDRATVAKGSRVTLTVTANVRDHVHLHGYDLTADIAPGKPARMGFEATLTGRFEIELEDAHQQIAQLTVTP